MRLRPAGVGREEPKSGLFIGSYLKNWDSGTNRSDLITAVRASSNVYPSIPNLPGSGFAEVHLPLINSPNPLTALGYNAQTPRFASSGFALRRLVMGNIKIHT